MCRGCNTQTHTCRKRGRERGNEEGEFQNCCYAVAMIVQLARHANNRYRYAGLKRDPVVAPNPSLPSRLWAKHTPPPPSGLDAFSVTHPRHTVRRTAADYFYEESKCSLLGVRLQAQAHTQTKTHLSGLRFRHSSLRRGANLTPSPERSRCTLSPLASHLIKLPRPCIGTGSPHWEP